MKNRLELAKYFAELGFTTGAEIGTEKGRYAEALCRTIPNLKLYCIDYWESYPQYTDFVRPDTFRNIYKIARRKLAQYNCVLIKKFSMDAVKDFADGSLDFVFIDGNHRYDFVRDDIRQWSKKVRKGGIVSGHDYYKTPHGNVGVINAVDEYVKEYGHELKLTDWDYSNPEPDNRQPSWYFTKL